MTPFERHLHAATGWLELSSPHDAHEELEQIEPAMRAVAEVLVIRSEIYRCLERWAYLETVTSQLCRLRPADPSWPVLQAYATRRAFSLERASGVLMNAVQRFPENSIIHYNLACYEAQLGNLPLARDRLKEAIRLEPTCREMALGDQDLVALHAELR